MTKRYNVPTDELYFTENEIYFQSEKIGERVRGIDEDNAVKDLLEVLVDVSVLKKKGICIDEILRLSDELSEMKDLDSENEYLSSVISRLEEENEELEDEMSSLKEDLEYWQKATKDLEEKLVGLKEYNESLKEIISNYRWNLENRRNQM